MIVSITDPADPRVEAYRQVRERDLVGRQGLFIAEGEVVVRSLVSSALMRTRSLLVAAHRLSSIEEILRRLPDEVPVFAVSQPVLDAIAGFPLHRGLMAVGQRIAAPQARALIDSAPDAALIVVLLGVGNHDNMGGVFRNAAAFGAHAVLIDPTSCDPLYRKAIRVSVGAALRVPYARWSPGEDPLQLLDTAGFEVLSLSPTGGETLSRLVPPSKAAILLGSEGPGLPTAVLEQTRRISIPMSAGFDSLNLATTAGIVLHHLTQGR
ncbi:MAG TPA: RNA methyltransferase [Caulobacteraceae bacterium]|nr:RNA methyltransferase [Caulobacteraceae bacterium]